VLLGSGRGWIVERGAGREERAREEGSGERLEEREKRKEERGEVGTNGLWFRYFANSSDFEVFTDTGCAIASNRR
jgi:hypothetical protein